MDHGTELQLVDFDSPLLLTFPNFLIKNLTFCFAGMHLTPSTGLFRAKGHILFTAHNLKNSEYKPSGIADNTYAHLQHETVSASGLFCFLLMGREGQIRTEMFLTNMQESVLELRQSKAWCLVKKGFHWQA